MSRRVIPEEFQKKSHDPSPSSPELMAKVYKKILEEVGRGNIAGPCSAKLAEMLDVSLGDACDAAMNLRNEGYVKVSKRRVFFCSRAVRPADKTVKKYKKL